MCMNTRILGHNNIVFTLSWSVCSRYQNRLLIFLVALLVLAFILKVFCKLY